MEEVFFYFFKICTSVIDWPEKHPCVSLSFLGFCLLVIIAQDSDSAIEEGQPF